MGELSQADFADLPRHCQLSTVRTVWIDKPDSQVQCIDRRDIPEGCCKRGNNEFQRSLQIASGSASDLHYHLFAARDLAFLPDEDYRDLARDLTEVSQKIDADRLSAKC